MEPIRDAEEDLFREVFRDAHLDREPIVIRPDSIGGVAIEFKMNESMLNEAVPFADEVAVLDSLQVIRRPTGEREQFEPFPQDNLDSTVDSLRLIIRRDNFRSYADRIHRETEPEHLADVKEHMVQTFQGQATSILRDLVPQLGKVACLSRLSQSIMEDIDGTPMGRILTAVETLLGLAEMTNPNPTPLSERKACIARTKKAQIHARREGLMTPRFKRIKKNRIGA